MTLLLVLDPTLDAAGAATEGAEGEALRRCGEVAGEHGGWRGRLGGDLRCGASPGDAAVYTLEWSCCRRKSERHCHRRVLESLRARVVKGRLGRAKVLLEKRSQFSRRISFAAAVTESGGTGRREKEERYESFSGEITARGEKKTWTKSTYPGYRPPGNVLVYTRIDRYA